MLTAPRLTRFGIAVAFALAAAFVILNVTSSGVDTLAGGRLGGDWAAFRTAGVLAVEDPSLLLDPAAQLAEMAVYLDGNFAPFPYPPLFAFLYVPFAFLTFQTGYVLYVLLLVVAGGMGIRYTMDLLDVRPPWRVVGYLGGLTYAGTFASWGGAQNATITLLLLAGGCWLLRRDHPGPAGVVLTLLWFKPQFAIPVIALLLVSRHVRTAVTMIAGGLVLWAGHAMVFGLGWMREWYEILTLTDQGNRLFNTGNTISPVEWIRGVAEAPWGDLLGLALALAIGLGFAVIATQRRDPADLLPLTLLALVLTAPHALRYELTLLVPAIGVLTHERGARAGVAAWIVAPVLLLEIPPLVRVAYVVAIATRWIATLSPLGWAPDLRSSKPASGADRTTTGSTITPSVASSFPGGRP